MALGTEACFLVSIGSMTRYWDRCEGGEKSADSEVRYNGGALTPQRVFGRPSWTDLVIGSDYDPDRDDPDIETLDALVGDGATEESVTVQPCDAELKPTGAARTYTGHVSKVTPPSADANSSTTATWSFTIAVNGRA